MIPPLSGQEDAMLTRRGFVACALCAVSGFIALDVAAQTTGIKRTILSQIDGPVDGYVTVSVRSEIDPGATVARHTHPGVETTYVVDGGVELDVDGVPRRALQAGDVFQLPANIVHGAKNGPVRTIVVSTFVVEKAKPLASPAPV
jgi:quercetin dioxygenase-like cupin family protein